MTCLTIFQAKAQKCNLVLSGVVMDASNNAPLSLNVCLMDLLSDSEVSSSAIIDVDNVIVLNPPSDKNLMITFWIEV